MSHSEPNKIIKHSSFRQGEGQIDFLYKHAPVGIWEEDWSRVKAQFDALPENDRKHFEDYLKSDPSHVELFKRLTKVISVNPAALQSYGFTEEEHDKFISEYDVYIADYMPDLLAFTQGNYVTTSVSEEVDRYGNKLIFRDIYCLPEGHRETWDRVICISQEVSDVLKHERIANEQLRHLEMAASIARIGYWSAGFGENAEIHFSGEYLDLMEFEDENGELVQKKINDAIHPDDRQRVLEVFRKADQDYKNYNVKYRIITPSGNIKYLREIGEIIKDSDGKPFSHHGIIQDITEQAEQEDKLAQVKKTVSALEDQFMGAINALKVGIALFDNNHALIKANNYFTVYFYEFDINISASEPGIYQAITQLIKNDRRGSDEKLQEWQHWFNNHERTGFEFYDGYSWFTLNKELQKDCTYIITLSDITELKNRENLLQEKQSELELLATKDALTNIYNRRKFNESLNHEFRRSMRTRDPLSLIMCDIDVFKKYNDHYGHLKGDDCLKMVAEAISSCFNRASDVVARYGGEEFAVILPNTGQKLAEKLAQKVCQAVKSRAIPHQLSKHDQVVTISVGVSTMNDCFDRNQIELIDAADNALYEAKENGRNRIEANLS